MYESLAGIQPAAGWHAQAKLPPFEGKESHYGLALGQDGNLGIRPEPTDCQHELIGKEWISEIRHSLLHELPLSDLNWAQFVWAHKADELVFQYRGGLYRWKADDKAPVPRLATQRELRIVAYTPVDAHYTVSAYCDNVSNKTVYTEGNFVGTGQLAPNGYAFYSASIDPPRTYGIRARVHFQRARV